MELKPTPPYPMKYEPWWKKYLYSHWWLFGVCLLLSMGAALLFLRYSTPVYQVSTSIMVKNDEENRPNAPSEDLVLRGLGIPAINRNLENEIQILKSTTLLQQVVRELGLEIQYLAKGNIRQTELFPYAPVTCDSFQLRKPVTLKLHILPDNTHFELSRPDNKMIGTFPFDSLLTVEYGTFRFHYQPTFPQQDFSFWIRFRESTKVAQTYANKIKIRPVGNATVLLLNLEDTQPDKAIAILNKLIEVYNLTAVREKQEIGHNTLHFIEKRLALLADELQIIEKDLEFLKTNLDPPEIAFANTHAYIAYLKDLENEELNLLERIHNLDSFQRLLPNAGLNQSPLPVPAFANPASELQKLIGQFNNQLFQKQTLAWKRTTAHPDMAILSQRLLSLQEAIQKSIKVEKEGLSRLKTNVQKRLKRERAALRNRPMQERMVENIQKQKKIKEELYLYLLSKKEETSLSMAVTPPGIRIIDPASGKAIPVWPVPSQILLIAFLLGLSVPLGVLFLFEHLNTTIRTVGDLKGFTSMPFLGSISIDRRGNPQKPLNPSDEAAEQLRLLQANLQFMLPANEKTRLLVTSATSKEGKTYVTCHLSQSLASSGKRVVVVDLDLRKPRLAQYFNHNPNTPGVSHYLAGKLEPVDLITPQNTLNNLCFISCGPIPPNPSELILQDRLANLFEYLDTQFDIQIIDAPPATILADALLIGTHCTNTLFIARAGKTTGNSIKQLEELRKNKKLPCPAILLNGVPSKGNYGYGYAPMGHSDDS